MTASDTRIHAAGSWLIVAGVMWVVSLALHPPLPPDLAGLMTVFAHAGARSVWAHWTAAVALSLFVVTSLIVLTSRSRLTASAWGLSAWAILPVAALWAMTAAVAEVTVMTPAAEAGDAATFEAWHAFAEGNAMGFMVLALSVATIAAMETRTRATPAWAAWTAVAAALVAFVGWILGPVLGIRIGGLLFVAGSVLYGLWLIWFGIGLARQPVTAPAPVRAPPSTETR